MPLDEVARRYADNIFRKTQEEVLRNQRDEIIQIRADHAKRGLLASGPHVNAHIQLTLRTLDAMAQAKADGLLRAYERSGFAFDDAAFQEVKSEVMEFCHSQQHGAVGAINQVIQQLFGQQTAPQFNDAFTQQICNGVSAIMARIRRDLEIRRDEFLLDDRKVRRAYAAGLGKKWDVFVCHASEDKEDFVRPLVDALGVSGLSVWYDELTMTVGDSLRRKIDEGLAKSRYGIVVVSPHFFAKEWPQNELDGLMSREIAGTKVILPVWHKVTKEDIESRSPILSGRLAAMSSEGVPEVVRKLRDAMGL